MSRSNLLLLTIALATFGIAVIAGHPDWGTFTGLAILLLAGGLSIGALPVRSERDIVIIEQRPPSQKLSNGLVTLSSAAILAVYVAGYHRTGSAANGFAARAARRRTTADLIVPGAVAPQAATPEVQMTPTIQPPSAKPLRKAGPKVPAAPVPSVVPPPKASEDSPTPFATPAVRPPDQTDEPVVPLVRTPQGKYKDGTYSGLGGSPHGDIQVSVVIQDGQIVSSEIARCLTRYPCSWIVHLPRQVVIKQGTAQVDYVSGATESCDAFFDAVAQALSHARE